MTWRTILIKSLFKISSSEKYANKSELEFQNYKFTNPGIKQERERQRRVKCKDRRTPVLLWLNWTQKRVRMWVPLLNRPPLRLVVVVLHQYGLVMRTFFARGWYRHRVHSFLDNRLVVVLFIRLLSQTIFARSVVSAPSPSAALRFEWKSNIFSVQIAFHRWPKYLEVSIR